MGACMRWMDEAVYHRLQHPFHSPFANYLRRITACASEVALSR